MTRSVLLRFVPTTAAERAYAASTFCSSAGHGLFLSTSAVFLLKYAHLSPKTIGLAITVASFVGIAGSLPAGSVGDRMGHRNTFLILSCTRGVCILGYFAVHSLIALLPVVCVYEITGAAASTCRKAYLPFLLDRARCVTFAAYNQAVFNVAVALGSALASVAFVIDTRTAFEASIITICLLYLLSSLVLIFLPRDKHIDAQSQTSVKSDLSRRYMIRSIVFGAISGIRLIIEDIFAIALPLWVVRWTTAPLTLIPFFLVLNTVMVAVLQVRLTRGLDDPVRAATAARRGGISVLFCCIICSVTHYVVPVMAVILLVAAVVFLTIGEILGTAAVLGLFYALAPPGRQGNFMGMWGFASRAASAGGPALVTSLTVVAGPIGWIGLGVIFMIAGTIQRPINHVMLKEHRAVAP